MKYLSTRGGESNLSFESVLFGGYASDGGLYFPESIPTLSLETLEEWKDLSYVDTAKRIAALFISPEEIPSDDLDDLIENAFEAFPKKVVRMTKLGDQGDLSVAELFLGPTLTFKDLALSVVGQLFEYFLEKRKKHMTILVGTSGDTGSAAINAVRGLKWVDIVVLLPKGRCTEIQERQMTTVMDDNVHNFAVEGTSDDLDVPIRQVFEDRDFVNQHNLCSINSINWARVLFQMSHFAFGYFRACKSVGEKVQFVVPTGACGNIAAGFILHRMGLPLELVASVAPNDIVHRTLNNGDFSLAPDVQASWASAIDIQVPYNLERIFFLASGFDVARIKNLMLEFEGAKKLQIPEDILSAVKAVIKDSVTVSNDEIVASIAKCKKDFGYTVCPHTAVALKYHFDHKISVPRVCVATASPAKFPEVLQTAGVTLGEQSPEIAKLLELPTKFGNMKIGQDWIGMLRQEIERISKARKQ